MEHEIFSGMLYAFKKTELMETANHLLLLPLVSGFVTQEVLILLALGLHSAYQSEWVSHFIFCHILRCSLV